MFVTKYFVERQRGSRDFLYTNPPRTARSNYGWSIIYELPTERCFLHFIDECERCVCVCVIWLWIDTITHFHYKIVWTTYNDLTQDMAMTPQTDSLHTHKPSNWNQQLNDQKNQWTTFHILCYLSQIFNNNSNSLPRKLREKSSITEIFLNPFALKFVRHSLQNAEHENNYRYQTCSFVYRIHLYHLHSHCWETSPPIT